MIIAIASINAACVAAKCGLDAIGSIAVGFIFWAFGYTMVDEIRKLKKDK